MNDIGFKLEPKQQLALSQSLVQSLKLLQMGHLELIDYINQEMLENPTLEEITYDESAEEKDYPENYFEENPFSAEELNERISAYENYWDEEIQLRKASAADYGDAAPTESYERFVSEEETLEEYLLQQLRTSGIRPEVSEVAEYLIECINTAGYLEFDEDEFRSRGSVSDEILAEAKAFIKTLDPVGVGASDLRECLLWQLEAAGVCDGALYRLVDEFLSEVADNKIGFLAKKLGLEIEEIQALVDEIRRLEPWPARNFKGRGMVNYVVPDVIVTRDGDEFRLDFVSNRIPNFRISSYYRDVLAKAGKDEELRRYLTEKITSGESLIYNINQRRDTILRIATAIVGMQQEFMEKGEKYLKPMLLKDVAEAVGVHESTVSRAVNGKYLQNENGIYEFKKLFSIGLPSGAEQTSTTEIKTRIKEMVAGENPNKPLSDQDISDEFRKSGVEVSRRTVAKYREELGILTSYKRKRF